LLVDLFADSLHVGQAGLERADDDAIWHFARDRGFAIVTKDSDFQERSQLAASAPRIVWIRRGNCSTQDIEALLREHAARVAALESEADARFLVLL
jgi:predicted nuclease of predicted toxin-antitoxin system